MAEELHVLFVGGQVGQPLARILLGRGKRVRIVKRSAGGLPEGAELVPGDATDLNFCVAAARGASTVYHCMNRRITRAYGQSCYRGTWKIWSQRRDETGHAWSYSITRTCWGGHAASRSTKTRRHGRAAGRERSRRASRSK